MFSKIKEKLINHKELFFNLGLFAFIMIWIICTEEIISNYSDSIKVITDNSSYRLLIAETLLYILGILLPYLICKIVFKHKINISFKFKKVYLKNVLLSILIGFIIQPFGMALSGISAIIAGGNNVTSAMQSLNPNCNVFLVALTLGLLPGIIEELIFRDMFFKNLNKKYSVLISAIISSLLFGIFHMNFQQFVYAVAIGFVFCYIYDKTKNILHTMIIHFTIDFSQTLLSFSLLKVMNEYSDEIDFESNSIDTISNVPFIIGCVIVLLLFSLWLKALIKKYKDENENKIETENKI